MLQHLENHVLMENTLHFILIKIIYIYIYKKRLVTRSYKTSKRVLEMQQFDKDEKQCECVKY